MPIFLREYGPSVAFGIPGLLMAVATVIFWAGRNKYVHVPPATSNPHSFLRVVRTALFAQGSGRMGLVVAGLGSVLALVALASLPGVVSGAESRSEEHTSELQSLMRTSYAVFCLKKKKKNTEYI